MFSSGQHDVPSSSTAQEQVSMAPGWGQVAMHKCHHVVLMHALLEAAQEAAQCRSLPSPHSLGSCCPHACSPAASCLLPVSTLPALLSALFRGQACPYCICGVLCTDQDTLTFRTCASVCGLHYNSGVPYSCNSSIYMRWVPHVASHG